MHHRYCYAKCVSIFFEVNDRIYWKYHFINIVIFEVSKADLPKNVELSNNAYKYGYTYLGISKTHSVFYLVIRATFICWRLFFHGI